MSGGIEQQTSVQQQVTTADGTPVPAEAVEAYRQGQAVGRQIRAEIAAGLPSYHDGPNGAQRYMEDTRLERSPYPDRHDDPQWWFYAWGAADESGLPDPQAP